MVPYWENSDEFAALNEEDQQKVGELIAAQTAQGNGEPLIPQDYKYAPTSWKADDSFGDCGGFTVDLDTC